MQNINLNKSFHVVYGDMADVRNMIGFPLVIADYDQDLPGIEPVPIQTFYLKNKRDS